MERRFFKNNTIDVIHTNIPSLIVESLVLPPLQANSGAFSDHRCVFAAAKFPEVRKFDWVMRWRRTRTRLQEEAFSRELKNWDWIGLKDEECVDWKASILEEVIAVLTERHFPFVRVRKRSNESPWITRHIRRLWKIKIRVYKKAGQCDKWWEIDRRLQELISNSREAFIEKMLEEGNSGKSFYAATRKLASATPNQQWSVKDVFPGKDAVEVCNEVLKYFAGIAASEGGPSPPVHTVPGGLVPFSPERTEKLLKAAKKTNSMVKGDPLPNLVRTFPMSFALPVACIYEAVNTSGKWPRLWKREHLTIIHKVPNPTDLSECRNISCTSLFSKVLEGEVLAKLRSELVPDPHQYGGTPKCGTEHMLIDMWKCVLSALEGGTDAAVLLGVDYEKAFNRMDHGVCLRKLKELGASGGSLALVKAFLEDRCMTITIDGHSSVPVEIKKGSPQGSVLGCLLYCVSTQRLTAGLRNEVDDNVRYFPQGTEDETEIRFWERGNGLPAAFL